VGTLSRDEIIRALREGRSQNPVAGSMSTDFISLHTMLPLEEAWMSLQTKRKTAAPVFAAGKLVGMLDTENIAEFLMINEARKKEKPLE